MKILHTGTHNSYDTDGELRMTEYTYGVYTDEMLLAGELKIGTDSFLLRFGTYNINIDEEMAEEIRLQIINIVEKIMSRQNSSEATIISE